MSAINDLTGQKFGRLRVVRLTSMRSKEKGTIWECRCDCGKISFVRSNNLVSGSTKSCGCFRNEQVGNASKNNDASIAREVLNNFNIEKSNVKQITRGDFKNNTSGIKGVGYHKRDHKWYASICANMEKIHLGYFDKKEDAIFARKLAEEIYFQPIIDKFNNLHPEL